MNENDAPARATRTMKPKIYLVDGKPYFATSVTQARSMHMEGIEARLATDIEIMDIGRRGVAVTNLTPAADDDGQADAFGRHGMVPPTSEY